MVWSRARIGFLAAAVLLAWEPRAAGDAAAQSSPPATTASVQLKDGRVLHNVRIMSDEGASVVVRADEGLLKVAKTNLPATFAGTAPVKASTDPLSSDPQLVMQAFDPNQAPEGPVPEPGARPAAKVVPGTKPGPPEASAVYKGCTIISFQPKSFQSIQGCAEVIIRNDSDQTVQIRPNDLVCMTSDGTRHPARNIVSGSFPPAVKRREFVPAGGQVDDIFTFTNESLDISGVRWAR